jgi:hypothetical protein
MLTKQLAAVGNASEFNSAGAARGGGPVSNLNPDTEDVKIFRVILSPSKEVPRKYFK